MLADELSRRDEVTMPNERPAPPLGDLKYLYVGTSRFDDDLEDYRDVVGAKEIRASRRCAWRRVRSSLRSLGSCLRTGERLAKTGSTARLLPRSLALRTRQ